MATTFSSLEEEPMFSDAQIQAYLDRIRYDGPLSLDRPTLDELVLRHQCSIPFETVTLHRSDKKPDLSLDALYHKIIENRLGGSCFELNKLFETLLCSLGFSARPVYSRAVRGRVERMPINHRGIVVQSDDVLYSVDVGFGGPMPAGALALEDGTEQLIYGESYATIKADESWWKIERITKGASDAFDDSAPKHRQVELELCEAVVEDQDFDALNLSCAQRGTLFRDHEIVNLRTLDGFKGLKDDVLTIRQEMGKQTIFLPSRQDVDGALLEHFAMDMTKAKG